MLKQYSYMRIPVLRRKLALAAALIAGAGAPPALAQTQYTFGTTGGGVYCDGLLLTQTGRVFKGTHNSPTNSCPEGDQAGGFWAMHYQAGAGGDGLVVNPTTTLITITSEEASLPGNVVVFNLDVANHVWNVWLGGPAVSNSFVLVNGGVLLSPPEAERARRAAQQAGGEARRYPAANRPAAFK